MRKAIGITAVVLMLAMATALLITAPREHSVAERIRPPCTHAASNGYGDVYLHPAGCIWVLK